MHTAGFDISQAFSKASVQFPFLRWCELLHSGTGNHLSGLKDDLAAMSRELDTVTVREADLLSHLVGHRQLALLLEPNHGRYMALVHSEGRKIDG
jgi:hypothetical protein